jgi:hypothetical protein
VRFLYYGGAQPSSDLYTKRNLNMKAVDLISILNILVKEEKINEETDVVVENIVEWSMENIEDVKVVKDWLTYDKMVVALRFRNA